MADGRRQAYYWSERLQVGWKGAMGYIWGHQEELVYRYKWIDKYVQVQMVAYIGIRTSGWIHK